MMWVFVVFILALILILKGGDLLVEASIWLAKKAKIPSVVVGATVVAIATTFPEMSVSVMSGISGQETLAINTAIGSMMSNFALVLGLSFCCFPSRIEKAGIVKRFVYFLFSIFILFALGVDQKLGLFDAIILLIVFVGFIVLNLSMAKKEKEPEFNLENLPSWWKTIVQFFVSALAIGYGANVLVSNVENLSKVLNVNEGLIGTFIIAVGTNIPEFVTTLTSIRLKDSGIGIGNIFGSSIIDATLLISATMFSSKNSFVVLPRGLLLLTIPMLILITSIIVFPILKKEKSGRIQGLILVVLFVLYSIILSKIS